MKHLNHNDQTLCVDDVAIPSIVEAVGTPCYIYSHATLVGNWYAFSDAFAAHPHEIYYSVKANSNLALLNSVANLGGGFDIVSGGELARVLAAKGSAGRIVFSGVAKQDAEIAAALKQNIHCFNVESAQELNKIAQLAQHLQVKAPIALRVNPDVDAKSHPYIATGLKESKFGIDIHDALNLYQTAHANPYLNITGVACHIGSQILELAPFEQALQRLMLLVEQLTAQGITLQHLDIGGGLGVKYHAETPPRIEDYAQIILKQIQHTDLTLMIEPGRALVADAGILVTRVLQLKQSGNKQFCIVDAAMNDLLRPALYDAYHEMIPVVETSHPSQIYDVVGPVCESGDFLGKQRSLAIAEGELLAILQAGAYAFSMSSNYNSRPRACEVLVKDKNFYVVRQRESIADLYRLEQLC